MEREFNDMKDVFRVLPTTQEEKEYMIVIGKHLATTEKFPTREAAEEKINSIDWNLIAAMIYACKEADEYEKWILIEHGFGYQTLYGHLNGFNVKIGDKVKRGNVIGFVGNSGTSTGPHLHYEVHKNGEPVNPQYYYFKDLNAQEYEKMVKVS